MNSARAFFLSAALVATAALAGCNTDSPGAPPVAAAPQQPLTHQQAALDCWMATEHGHADLPLDKRADLVNACIADKMAGKPWPEAEAKTGTKSAANGKPKPESKPGSKPKGKPKTAAKPASKPAPKPAADAAAKPKT